MTILFCDVTGSTAMGERSDPEVLRGLLARYFERMRGIVESHGGTVEKFIGDAVMAVFGVPAAHEDDALRACRAAVEMRDALPELGVEARLGVNTGEVVTGTAERLATGDAVNVAARLEQAAVPGSILIGDATLRARPRRRGGGVGGRLLALKGKASSGCRHSGCCRCSRRPERIAHVAFRRTRAGAGRAGGRLGAGGRTNRLRARHARRGAGRGQVAAGGRGACTRWRRGWSGDGVCRTAKASPTGRSSRS